MSVSFRSLPLLITNAKRFNNIDPKQVTQLFHDRLSVVQFQLTLKQVVKRHYKDIKQSRKDNVSWKEVAAILTEAYPEQVISQVTLAHER